MLKKKKEYQLIISTITVQICLKTLTKIDNALRGQKAEFIDALNHTYNFKISFHLKLP